MRHWIWAAAAAAVIALPSSALAQPGTVHPGQAVINFSTADQRMNAAIARARETVGDLLRRLEAPVDSGVLVTVKVRVAEGDVAEHMWIRDVRYEDGMLHGLLNNVPRDLHGVKLGDTLHVAPGEISDWMVVDHGALCGGFTFRVSMSQMNARQRIAVYRQQGIRSMPLGDEVCAAAAT